MKDILPREMEIRDYVIGQIKETYRTFGFQSIETPCVEHIENLNNKQGGENEKLIFKILKRGQKLNLETAETESDLVDGGLRYDLTVPLSRYYANNANELPVPFKALQMGNVWRADRPQRGRYRQFMQCDIDILGEPSNLAEIELILATTTLLGKLDFENFTIRINNRKILKGMAAFCGFPEEEYDEVFIILDKMDKIGMDGVVAELLEAGYAGESVEKCKTLFETVTSDIEGVRYMKDTLGEFLEEGSAEDLETIISTVEKVKTANFKIVFDPTLVRGMSYYTGPIFEIAMDEFGGSVGGGGRYDEMIGKFTGNNTCACGFSIGFERIVMLLLERDYKVPSAAQKKAYLIDKKASADVIAEVIEKAKAEGREFFEGNPQDNYPDSLDKYRKLMKENKWEVGEDDEELFEYAMHPAQYEAYKSGKAKEDFLEDVAKRRAEKDKSPEEDAKPKTLTVQVDGQAYRVTVAYGDAELPATPAAAAAPAGEGQDVLSPLEGKFFLVKNAQETAMKVGDVVKEGDVLCYVEAMKTYNAIRAEFGGTITAICANPGDTVSEDDVLMKIG